MADEDVFVLGFPAVAGWTLEETGETAAFLEVPLEVDLGADLGADLEADLEAAGAEASVAGAVGRFELDLAEGRLALEDFPGRAGEGAAFVTEF